jgi:DNA-binding NarL/FixJ family response regulator
MRERDKGRGVHVPRVLVFTAHTSVEDVAGATLAGADGYLHIGVVGKELLHTVRRTHAGRRVWLLPAVQSSHRARYTSPVSKDVFPLTITGSRAPGTKTDN